MKRSGINLGLSMMSVVGRSGAAVAGTVRADRIGSVGGLVVAWSDDVSLSVVVSSAVVSWGVFVESVASLNDTVSIAVVVAGRVVTGAVAGVAGAGVVRVAVVTMSIVVDAV